MLLLRVNTVLGQSYIMTNGSTITTCSGTFYDPGGPNENYDSNSGFTQTFVSSNPNSCLQVTFTSLELEANYDKLLIYGTTTPTGTPIATLTGVQSNTTIVSFSNTMTFVFTSDGSVNKAGWEAVISCGDCPDPSSMHNGTETVYCSQAPISFYDPGGPSGNYGANQTFTQTFITSDPNKCLQVTFTSFETESDYDKLKVYYGTSASGNAFETYSGSIPNGFTITSYTDALTFQFISNNSIQKAGWVATVSCIDCADTCIPRSTNDGSPCSDETLAHPFCTDENPYGITYPSGTGSNNAHSTFFGISSGNVGCLYTTPRPAWYYMQIDQPGDLLIRIEQFDTAGVGRDVDFACWGPFSASSQSDFLEKLCCGKYLLYTTQQNSHHPTNGDHSNNATGGYPYGNLVDCSYSTSYTEWCFIPDAQQGEWYLLLMTNYSGQPGQITFNTVAEYSSATTNCNLLAPISYNAPLCEGDTLVLTCENPLSGAIYNWSGPGGWTAVTLVPSVSILNTTTSQSGQYNLQITGIDTTVLPSQVDVTIHAIPTVTLTVSSDHICEGNSVTLQASGAETYHWTSMSATGNSVTVTPASTTTYTVIGTNGGCADTATHLITVFYNSSRDTSVTVCDSLLWNGVYLYADTVLHDTLVNVHGCDSIVTLHLTVHHGTHHVETATACVSYVWHGETYTASGTYTYDYENAEGCPSVDTLHLTIDHAEFVEFAETVCEEYVWNDETLTTSGDYTRTFTNSNGCDSIVTLRLTVNYGTHNVEFDTACRLYVWHDAVYTESGTYTYSYRNENGCLNVDTLHLIVNPIDITEFTESACEAYVWNDSVYTQSGHYKQIFTNANGCDSIVTLNLRIFEIEHQVYTVTACESYSWEMGDGQIYTTSGDYTYEYINDNGCTQMDTLHLTINNPVHHSSTVSAYDSYTWVEGDGNTYSVSGTYHHTLIDTNGCEQVDTLHLTIHYSSANDYAAVACESYEWDNVVYTTSGDYTRHYQDIYGADSTVTLHLVVHYGTHEVEYDTACESHVWHGETYTTSGIYTYEYENADGCLSADTLHLTVNSADFAEFAETVCEEYVWNNETFTTSGDYTRTFTNANGCDSVVTLHLTVNYPTHTAVTETAFDSYTWTAGNDSTYTQSGTYYYTHPDTNECTQVDTLYLTIHYSTANEFSVTACESYEWDGVVYTTSGDYTRQYQDIYGADSTVTLHLVIRYGTHEVEYDTACVSYIWHGETYTTSGTYTYEYENADGCPSVDTLHLTVNSADFAEFAETVCGEHVWNNETFTTSGDYTRTFTNANGCDSVVTLHLTVNYPTHTAVTDTAFDSYTWTAGNGSTYTQSGTYYYTHFDANGCTQVDTLYLTIHYSSANDFAAVACESYEWDGVVYTTSGDYARQYQDINGADSTVTLHLVVHYGTHEIEYDTTCVNFTWHGETYTTSGIYTYAYDNADGCPSTDTLHLTINTADLAEFAEAACEEYVWNGETFTTSGDYTRTFTNSHGCDSVVTLHLTVNYPTHTAITETAIDSYTWTAGNGSTYTQSGTYFYSHLDTNGCTQVDTLYLTIHYSSANDFAAVACESYEWDGVVFITSGDYTRTFTNSHGCDSVVTLHLTVSSLSAEIDNITHVRCFNESTGAAEVTVSGGISPLAFQWTNESGATVSSTTALSNQPAGSYTFTVTDAIGCSDTVNITLNTLHQEMQAGTITGPSSLCSGDSLGWIHGTEAIGNGCAYQWQISAGNTNWNAAPSVNNTQNYNYNALATNDFKLRRAWISDECGTLYSNILEVEVVDTALRIITLTPDFCEEMSAELMMETFMTDYIWSTGEQTQHITVTNPGYYSVTATQNGCIASAGYLIEACESHLYLPNAITPGRGDGLNDYFCIPEGAKNDIALFEISIFNCWGEQVFYSTDMNFRWNGEYKGKIYHQNVYTYIIRYTNNVGKPYYVTGTITVL